MADIEHRTRSYGLPPIRWPDPWPSDYLSAMRAATFAFAAGRGREFTMQAFRSAFVHGRDLSLATHVLEAGAQAGLDRDQLMSGIADPEIKSALRAATEAACERGVFRSPHDRDRRGAVLGRRPAARCRRPPERDVSPLDDDRFHFRAPPGVDGVIVQGS